MYWLETRRQKFHQYRLFSVIHARCFLHSKALLQAYAQYRNFSTLAVIEFDSATRRNLDMSRSQPIDFLLKIIRNAIPQNFFQIDFLQFTVCGNHMISFFQIEGKPVLRMFHQIRSTQIRNLQFRMPFCHLSHAPLQHLHLFIPVEHAKSIFSDSFTYDIDNQTFINIMNRFAINNDSTNSFFPLNDNTSLFTVPRNMIMLCGEFL